MYTGPSSIQAPGMTVPSITRRVPIRAAVSSGRAATMSQTRSKCPMRAWTCGSVRSKQSLGRVIIQLLLPLSPYVERRGECVLHRLPQVLVGVQVIVTAVGDERVHER